MRDHIAPKTRRPAERVDDRSSSERRAEVVIIGAGPAGLVAAKQLADLGLFPREAIVVYEQGGGVGGTFATKAQCGVMWNKVV